MKSISTLGFKQQWMMDHTGTYGNMIDDLKAHGGLTDVPLMSQEKLPIQMKSFYGREIFNDEKVLERWMNTLGASQPTVTFFNTIVLHDGNRELNGDGMISYHAATKKLHPDCSTNKTPNVFLFVERFYRSVTFPWQE